jgi:hypothetical protein
MDSERRLDRRPDARPAPGCTPLTTREAKALAAWLKATEDDRQR